jgi:hypothetical protein
MNAPISEADEILDLKGDVAFLKHRLRLMARGYLILLVVSVVSGWLAFSAVNKVSASDHAGAVQRVTTISQRCDLTAKIREVLLKDDPLRLPAFQASYEECKIGLRKAEKLAGVKAKPVRQR